MSLWEGFIGRQARLTNKWAEYFAAYERHFSRYRNQAVTLLEIGAGDGGSLQLWKRFFGPHARLVGIDIRPECKEFEEDQIRIYIGSQSDSEFLEALLREVGPVQIVIDDGSHRMADVTASFTHIYHHPMMDVCGIYAIEDLHTAYWEEFGGGHLREDSFIERAKLHVDELNAHHTRGAVPPSRLTANTLSIHFYDSLVIYERGRRGPNRNLWA